MFSESLLKSKRILITGGGTGLGKAMANRFLQLGATVYICGRREEVLQKTAAELSATTHEMCIRDSFQSAQWKARASGTWSCYLDPNRSRRIARS